MNDLQIDYFLAVAENLSFTKTAKEKYVSQPAISKQITALEEELGVLLFERGRKSTELTDAGKLFADFYRRQRAELGLLSRQAKEMQDKMYVPLKIAFGAGWTLVHFMPGVVKKVQEALPTTIVSLACNELVNLETMLQKDQVDLIISLEINVHPTPNIEVRHLVDIPGSLIYSRHHPAAAKAKAPIDFKDEVFLVPLARELDFIINLVNSFVEPHGFTPKIRRAGNVETMLANIINGIGVAIVDDWVIGKNRHSFLTLPIDVEYTVVAAWKKGNKNPALAAFREELFNLPPEVLR
ncbi:MAG: LysR family transcriptional regulator [Clostridiales bacterium]|nr:LysR family transcriptional regulator [Clostridiales bacterium]